MNEPSAHAPDLTRRLDEVASTTTFSPDAWERIAARTVDQPHASGTHRVLILGAAAAALAIGVAAVVVTRSDGDQQVIGAGDPAPEEAEPSTTVPSVPPTTVPSTPVTTVPVTPPTSGGPVSSGPPSCGQTPGGWPTTVPSRPCTGDARQVPAVMVANESYTVEVVVVPRPDGGLDAYLRRADDVGSTIAGVHDVYGSAYAASFGPIFGDGDFMEVPDDRCLAVDGPGTSSSVGTEPAHTYVFGFVGRGATSVSVVMPDGTTWPAEVGSTGPSAVRPWVAEYPGGAIGEITAADATGATWSIVDLAGTKGQTECDTPG